MLKPTWYLPDADWFALLPDAPQLSHDDQAVIGQVAQLFGEEWVMEPALTVAATHVILLAVEHLDDTMTHAAESHDLTEVTRLLCGLNLIQAYLTQTIQRITEHVDARTFNGSAAVPTAAARSLTESLSTAGAHGEIVAGHLKEAHLTLRTATT